MPLRVLYGPTSSKFAASSLGALRAAGECRTFGPVAGDGIDHVVPAHAAWAELEAALPADWRPDVLALYLAYSALPAFLDEVPVPIVGVGPDWNLLGEAYRLSVPLCDLVLTDGPGVAALRRAGFDHAEQALLFGTPDDWATPVAPDTERDIDLLFVGNCQPHVTRGRLPLVARLAELADRHRVVIKSNLPFAEYRDLHRRARVVVNPTARGEWNLRVGEAVACGCLLAIDASNAEVLDVLRPDRECVTFTAQNLEAVLDAALADEPRRIAIARAAQEKLGDPTFARFWREAMCRVEGQLGTLRQRHAARSPVALPALRRARVLAHLSAEAGDPTLLDEVATTYRPTAATPAELNDLALLYLLAPPPAVAGLPQGTEQAGRLWEVGVRLWPNQAVLGYNLVRLLLANDQRTPALNLARHVLRQLETLDLADESALAGLPWPVGYDAVFVEWLRAGWEHPTDAVARNAARRTLLRWSLQLTVGNLDERAGVAPFYEAVRERDDLADGRAGLGCALARTGQQDTAIPHLRAAVAASPFDRRMAAALAQVLHDARRAEELRAFQEQRRRLHRAAPELVPQEDWFAAVPTLGGPVVTQPGNNGVVVSGNNGIVPANDGVVVAGTNASSPRPSENALASLIILCHNEADVTRACLGSVLRHTRRPYEVILVDNASTDATPALLEEFRRQRGPARVEVIRNATNAGFGAGCNQGIAAARGAFLVFLNNDTLVTPRWLTKLVALSLHDFPRFGLTGPVSNRAIPEQTIATNYADEAGMLAFAQENERRHAHGFDPRDRLSGFCLLARRDVLDRIGGFDERFGLGYFEDDDFCLQARFAGYDLAVALDAFVHHLGGQTSAKLGIDTEALMRANLERFRAKWGDRLPAGYRNCRLTALGTTLDQAERHRDDLFAQLPAEAEAQRDAVFSNGAEFSGSIEVSPLADLPDYRRQEREAGTLANVSLCIIARDEEQNIADCIGPTRGLFGDVLVNDTGSKDRTVAIAKSLGARVIENPWGDSFCAARNQGLEAALGDWIFWLDADDRLSPSAYRQLAELFRRLPSGIVGYSMTCRCDSAHGDPTDVAHLRLFPRRPEIRWRHRIHEQILPALREAGGDVIFRHDIVIRHTGYADPALRSRKLDRDLRLLEMERREIGDHPFTLFNLGNIYTERGNHIEAYALYRRSLDQCHPTDSITRKLFANLARAEWLLGQREYALADVQAGREHYPRDAELLFLAAQFRHELGQLEEARQLYHELIEGPEDAAHFGSTSAGLRGYVAMQNLGLVYRDLGRAAEARHWFAAAVARNPLYTPAWFSLADLLAAHGDRQGVGRVVAEMGRVGLHGEADAVRQRHLQ